MKMGLIGHFLYNRVVNAGFISDGVRGRRSRKDERWDTPMVCAPERATISVMLSPLAAKRVMRSGTPSDGAGRSRLASVSLAVSESLLPRETVHDGPPTYTSEADEY